MSFGVKGLTGFWLEDVKEGDHLEDVGVDGNMKKWTFKKWDGRALNGLIRLRVERSDELLGTR
jgi:hypothetical protein